MQKIILLACSLLIPITLYAAPKNPLPQGKPFQYLQSEIDSLNAEVNSLVGRVESLEQRVTATEEAIAKLQAENQELQVLISSTSGDISDLQEQIDHNKQLIALMQSQMVDMQKQIALKQNFISGICPDGQAVISIEADGSLVCASSGSGGVQMLKSYNMVCIPDNYGTGCGGPADFFGIHAATAIASCPDGYMTTGGGFSAPWQVHVIESRPQLTNSVYGGWLVTGRNDSYYSSNLYSYAICLKQ